MNTSTVAKKDITKLQRAIVDGLEDVKAQDIQVFDTEHLSSLFERVIVASGTSNRQTKALAASVRDAVREAGFPKPRIEGEENGEWIIVDCGQAVVHVMQPTFRQYYNLEELWGEKPVRLKLGSAKPAVAESAKPAVKAAPKVEPTLKRSNAAKKGVAEAFPSKAQLKKDADKASKAKAPARKSAVPKPAAKSAASSGAAAPAKKVVAKKVPTSAKRTVVGKPAAKPAAKSAARPAAKKPAPRKA
jgi:ribosome-associated protein